MERYKKTKIQSDNRKNILKIRRKKILTENGQRGKIRKMAPRKFLIYKDDI